MLGGIGHTREERNLAHLYCDEVAPGPDYSSWPLNRRTVWRNYENGAVVDDPFCMEASCGGGCDRGQMYVDRKKMVQRISRPGVLFIVVVIVDVLVVVRLVTVHVNIISFP